MKRLNSASSPESQRCPITGRNKPASKVLSVKSLEGVGMIGFAKWAHKLPMSVKKLSVSGIPGSNLVEVAKINIRRKHKFTQLFR